MNKRLTAIIQREGDRSSGNPGFLGPSWRLELAEPGREPERPAARVLKSDSLGGGLVIATVLAQLRESLWSELAAVANRCLAPLLRKIARDTGMSPEDFVAASD